MNNYITVLYVLYDILSYVHFSTLECSGDGMTLVSTDFVHIVRQLNLAVESIVGFFLVNYVC